MGGGWWKKGATSEAKAKVVLAKLVAAAGATLDSESDEAEYLVSVIAGAGNPQHGLSSNKMALITSEYGIMCSLRFKWP